MRQATTMARGHIGAWPRHEQAYKLFLGTCLALDDAQGAEKQSPPEARAHGRCRGRQRPMIRPRARRPLRGGEAIRRGRAGPGNGANQGAKHSRSSRYGERLQRLVAPFAGYERSCRIASQPLQGSIGSTRRAEPQTGIREDTGAQCPQPMSASRPCTHNSTFAPTGSVTLVGTCPKGKPVRMGVVVRPRRCCTTVLNV